MAYFQPMKRVHLESEFADWCIVQYNMSGNGVLQRDSKGVMSFDTQKKAQDWISAYSQRVEHIYTA